MTTHRVSRTDSADLGFAWSCLLAGAVDMGEVQAWAERVVAEMPSGDLPPYMIDLMLAEERRDLTVGLREITGFWPSDPELSAPERAGALSGIAALRGRFRPDDSPHTEAQAVAILRAHPAITRRFATLFPDISLTEPA